MIPVQKQSEPKDFDILVRQRGLEFLKATPFPVKKQWDKHRYWKEVLEDIYIAYNGICSYLGEWISRPGSIDHFKPKSRYPSLAYEWDNYRFCLAMINNYKGDNEEIADPFLINDGWFELDFPSCLINAGSGLSEDEEKLVLNTIDILKLNSENLVSNRSNIVLSYCKGEFPFDHLREKYPFIATELERQNLIEDIKRMIKSL